jgi:signal transduction histidine kinase
MERDFSTPNLIEIIHEVAKIKDLYSGLLNHAATEIMLIIPTDNALERDKNSGIIQMLRDRSTNHGIRVRILSPAKVISFHDDGSHRAGTKAINDKTNIRRNANFQTRLIAQTIGPQQRSIILIVDRKFSLVMELKDDSKEDFMGAIGTSIYSNSNATVSSYASIFENLWHQSELYEQIILANEHLEEKSEEILLKDKELQTLIFKLLEEDKSKEEFMSMVSHELKTPISVIKLYSDMLLKVGIMGSVTEKQERALHAVSRNVKKLELLVSDILDVYKLDIGKMSMSKSSVNVVELVNQTISDLQSFSDDKDVRIVTNFEYADNVYCDPQRIGQVLSNLIKNSLDFVPKQSGRIVIRTENYNYSKNNYNVYENSEFSSDYMILFTVEDNGTGIRGDRVANVFKKFYQIDTSLARKHGGTGLGLAICKGIVEAHGGLIWIDKSSSHGTIVKFTLPKSNSYERS